VIIDFLINDGNHHFAVTINLPQNHIYLVEEYVGECLDYNYRGFNNKIEFSGQELTSEFGL